MASWAAKRRFSYGGVFILIITLLIGLVFWKIIYRAPTCSDGVQNGEEKGIDCGGACQKICTSDALTPVVLWSKIFNISGDTYTATAFVENPNITSKNSKATYQFKIYDENNKLITVVDGETSIPKGKKFAVFETGIVLKGTKPKSADFEFISFGPWEKDTTKALDVVISHSSLISATTSPRITGTITNNGTEGIDQVELVVLVLDSNENAVATSRSFIDNLSKKTSQDFVFTWPKAFSLGVEACVSPLDIEVVLDKSGSMRSEGSNPPEPFTTVLSTAKDFIQNLTDEDNVAVTSFGTNSALDSLLSNIKDVSVAAIDSLTLSTTSEQTNIYAGLMTAFNELRGDRARPDSKKAIILLTDGLPTEPQDKNVANNPTISAQNIAKAIKDAGITLYTIGLGKNVSGDFLKSISSDDAHYFEAPTKEILGNIYTKISSNLCVKKPNVITVIYRSL